MKRLLPMLVPALLAGLAGCQCSGLTERYSDGIDDISDHTPNLEGLYHPCFDLTRIGRPDWMDCGFNRLWCRNGGVQCCGQRPCPFCAKDTGLDPVDYLKTQPGPGPEGPSAPGIPPAPKPEVDADDLPTLILSDEGLLRGP
ncbi:MAG: hypothetical protein ACE5KM_11740 [Planctomycetaceae bacterium]